MTNTPLIVISFVAVAALGACAQHAGDDTTVADPTSLHARLGHSQLLELAAPSAVEMNVREGAEAPMDNVRPEVLGGHTQLRATNDGFVIVEALAIDLGDVTVRKDWPSEHTVELTGIQLRLGTQLAIDAEWTELRVSGTGRADLLMDWAIRTEDGDVLPLATQRARDVEVYVDASAVPGDRLHGSVSANVLGQVWRFSTIEVHDLTMALHAQAAD